MAGDKVVVNRWSYGLRTGDGRLFSYGRICQQTPVRGDYVAFEDSLGNVLIGRCTALPGDTVTLPGRGRAVMPGRASCDAHDCYFMDKVGIVTEERIIGRVVMVLFNHKPGTPFWSGYDGNRTFMLR